MSEPTGKLKFAYNTIRALELEIEKLKLELRTDNYTIEDLNHQIEGFKEQLAQERKENKNMKSAIDQCLKGTLLDEFGNRDEDGIYNFGTIKDVKKHLEGFKSMPINPPSEVRE